MALQYFGIAPGLLMTVAVPCPLMENEAQKEKALYVIRKCEKYFYKYLLTYDRVYIDRFFTHTRKLKRMVQRWKT